MNAVTASIYGFWDLEVLINWNDNDRPAGMYKLERRLMRRAFRLGVKY